MTSKTFENKKRNLSNKASFNRPGLFSKNFKKFEILEGSSVSSFKANQSATWQIVVQLLEKAPGAILITDDYNRIIYANKAIEQLLKYRMSELRNCSLKKVLSKSFEKSGQSNSEIETTIITSEGIAIPVLVARSNRIVDNKTYYLYFCTDISAQKEKEKKLKCSLRDIKQTSENLRQLVKTDALTELLNRRGLENILEREQELAKRDGTDLVAALIDLDDFKSINSEFGHAGGDLVLKSVAAILRDCLRSSDWIGRVGGDEFMVFLPNTNYTEAVSIAERMRARVAKEKITKYGKTIKVTTSTGLSKLDLDNKTLQEVMEKTRSSLEHSKSSGKNKVSAQNQGKQLKISELLEQKELYQVVSQPIYNLSTNNIQALELFSRGPSKELFNPEVFFQIAKENRILSQIDLNCLENCLDYASGIDNDYIIHLNIFPSTLETVPLERILKLTEPLRRQKTICLDLTAKSLHENPELLVSKINHLKESGILICLDDVGAGFSSIETLAMLEPHCIKLDRSIVSELVCDINKVTTTARIMTMAHAINCLIIAEGVETEDELQALKRLNILYAQGRYWKGLPEAASA